MDRRQFLLYSSATALTLSQLPGTVKAAQTIPPKQSWRVVPGSASGKGSLTGISALNKNIAWTVGYEYELSQGTMHPVTDYWNRKKWQRMPSPAPGENSSLHDCVMLKHDNVWAVGNFSDQHGSQPMIQHWDGQTWHIVDSPQVGTEGFETSLSAVDALAPDNIWAVGAYRKGDGIYNLVEHWDGQQWNIVQVPAAGDAQYSQSRLMGINMLAPNDIWITGSYWEWGTGREIGVILHWDGQQWDLQTLEETYPIHPQAITAIAKDDVWIVGVAHGGVTFTTHWDGKQWTQVSSPHLGDLSQLSSVVAFSPHDIWAAGFYTGAGLTGLTLVMHWDGHSWSVVDSPTPPGPDGTGSLLQDIAIIPRTRNLWAVGITNLLSIDNQTLTMMYC